MKIIRWSAAVFAVVSFLLCTAYGENCENVQAEYISADMSREEVHEFVGSMFNAVTGTSSENEKEQRKDLTDEESMLRNMHNAEYRARTIPWIEAVFDPELVPEEVERDSCEIQPTIFEDAPDTLQVFDIYDSYEAFDETEQGREYLALLGRTGADNCAESLLVTHEICMKWLDEIDHNRLADMNADYYCWLYAPGTQIDYPVVQSDDNSFYLKRMFNGERNSAGTLFVDYRNLTGFQDPNTLIYGHHMRNDSMFGTLTDYSEQAYFEGHPYMLVISENEIFILEIFAGYTTSDQDHCYDIAVSDEEDKLEFIEEAGRKSDFESGVCAMTSDRMVTLSTCAYAFEDARYILIGRIVPVWLADDTAQHSGE